MHNLEPFYNWRHIYVTEEDERSPFFKKQYSEFEFTQTVYNYFIHPQWDNFGSSTLYLKILMADYDEKYTVLEFIGEWNDAVENDIMTLKRGVLEKLMDGGINKFILIGENVLNFHSDNKDYYEEFYEEVTENNGWVVALNFPEQTCYDFKKDHIDRIIQFIEMPDWRAYKPFHLFKKIEKDWSKRLVE